MRRARPWVAATIVLAALVHVLTVKAYPYAVMLRLKHGRDAKVNTMLYSPRVSDSSRSVVRPSPDLLYSVCAFNVSERPLRLQASVPEGTYWSVSGFAANTDNFFTLNDRTLGAKAADLILVKKGSRVEAPAGARVIESPTARGVILIRILIPDEDRLEELIKVQKMAACAPLQEEK